MKRPWFVLALAGIALAAGGYHLVKRYPLPGDGGWDYLTVDGAARRLYASHGSQVQVVDLESGAVLRTIAAKGAHGKKPDAILYDDATRRVFANNGDSASSTVIDSRDGAVLGTVDLGGGQSDLFFKRRRYRQYLSRGFRAADCRRGDGPDPGWRQNHGA